jgi:hypothetical protein
MIIGTPVPRHPKDHLLDSPKVAPRSWMKMILSKRQRQRRQWRRRDPNRHPKKKFEEKSMVIRDFPQFEPRQKSIGISSQRKMMAK